MTEEGKKYLSDISRAIDLIESFTNKIDDFEEYHEDLKTQSATERQLATGYYWGGTKQVVKS